MNSCERVSAGERGRVAALKKRIPRLLVKCSTHLTFLIKQNPILTCVRMDRPDKKIHTVVVKITANSNGGGQRIKSTNMDVRFMNEKECVKLGQVNKAASEVIWRFLDEETCGKSLNGKQNRS